MTTKALRSFPVRPRLPEALAPLDELALNLRWSWDERTRDLFRWVDPDGWEASRADPVAVLAGVGRERLAELEGDAAFLTYLAEVYEGLHRYLDGERWFQTRTSPVRSIAYFSPEFGIAEALPQYSGGLGILAGDHLKAASDLGVPLVGVGLLYRHGYFRQSLNSDGWQQERYPTQDPWALAVRPTGAGVTVDMAGSPLHAAVWRADVGRVRLYLLDADVEENDEAGRSVTDRLYGGDVEHRLRQEVLLGIGGVRALVAVGEDAQVFHTNEGHAGFLGLERIRRLVTERGLTFAAAVEATRSATVFTTHTPVPAGIDRFPRPLMERYFAGWAKDCGVSIDDLLAVGREPGDADDGAFNMAVMGLRLAGRANGVSKLHGDVSRSMFAPLWPGVPEPEVPITSVTNGVHAGTWVSAEVDDLLTRHVLPEWHEAGPDRWQRLAEAGDHEVFRVREAGRERLVSFVRKHLRASLVARGAAPAETGWCDDVLDPRVLTVGFARRFATYKRATLLLSQPDRLKRLLLSPDQPVQLVFAGKAHPADEAGKEMIRQIVSFSAAEDVRHRIVFLDDYDIALARVLYQGADVWLNNPRRPLEACGTSGMKAALNGALNLSVADGWWDEWADDDNGWVIPSAEDVEDMDKRDSLEADALFSLLERTVVPLYYERREGPVRRAWTRRVKSSLISLGPKVSASRMVRDYVEGLYEPTAVVADRVAADGYAPAGALADWKARVTAAWPEVRVVDILDDAAGMDLGSSREVTAEVSLGPLQPSDVTVELVHGRVGLGDELTPEGTVAMVADGPTAAGLACYRGTFGCETPGRYGYAVRVVPNSTELVTPLELGKVTWA